MALSDQALLAADPTFQSRVREALSTICQDIATEAVSGLTGTMPLQLHVLRARLATTIQTNLLGSSGIVWAQTFALGVATDPTTIAAATQNGTVSLTTSNAAAQAALVPDADITNAISAQFNGYLTVV